MSATKKCPFCAEEVQAEAVKCKHCKEFIGEAKTGDVPGPAMAGVATESNPPPPSVQEERSLDKDFSKVLALIGEKEGMGLKSNVWKVAGWFAMTNGAVMLSLLIITGFEPGGVTLAMIALVLGCACPFVMLFLSKWLAIKGCGIKLIKPGSYASRTEEHLYLLVKGLAEKAGIEKTPEVGIYDSPEVNAFATGPNRNSSLVAFSSSLLRLMDEDAIAAVAAHEVAHVANGDMVTMSIMQGVVNAVVMLANIPLAIIQWWMSLDHRRADFLDWGVAIFRFVLVAVLAFLGNLLMKWFSRHREFKADEMASRLVDHRSMAGALRALRANEGVEVPRELREAQASFAAFKIAAPPALFDLFATHPSLERRINRLESLAGGGQRPASGKAA